MGLEFASPGAHRPHPVARTRVHAPSELRTATQYSRCLDLDLVQSPRCAVRSRSHVVCARIYVRIYARRSLTRPGGAWPWPALGPISCTQKLSTKLQAARRAPSPVGWWGVRAVVERDSSGGQGRTPSCISQPYVRPCCGGLANRGGVPAAPNGIMLEGGPGPRLPAASSSEPNLVASMVRPSATPARPAVRRGSSTKKIYLHPIIVSHLTAARSPPPPVRTEITPGPTNCSRSN